MTFPLLKLNDVHVTKEAKKFFFKEKHKDCNNNKTEELKLLSQMDYNENSMIRDEMRIILLQKNFCSSNYFNDFETDFQGSFAWKFEFRIVLI